MNDILILKQDFLLFLQSAHSSKSTVSQKAEFRHKNKISNTTNIFLLFIFYYLFKVQTEKKQQLFLMLSQKSAKNTKECMTEVL